MSSTLTSIDVQPLHDLDGLAAASALWDQVWGTGPGDSYLSPSLLRALEHAGNYTAGAYIDGTLVGAVMGFLGTDGSGPYLHSHILGVDAAHRGANIGFLLKQHQRAWALAHRMSKITWTFDPLVRRNAFFNVTKLGADVASYLVNFYGQMDDDINGTDESDRILIEWLASSNRALQAAAAPLGEPPTDGATVVFTMDGEVRSDGWGPRLLCATPQDIVALRQADPDAGLRWRRGLRATLGAALEDGYVVSGFTRSGWYVLDRA